MDDTSFFDRNPISNKVISHIILKRNAGIYYQKTMDDPLEANVIFEVRNDKLLGIVVLTIQCANTKVPHFFREHHQPLKQHPEQLQEIVKRKCPSVAHKKTIHVDIISFVREYYDGVSFEFKGVLLRSSAQQMNKVYDRKLNRQIGAQKRLQTIKESKQRKIDEKNKMIRNNLEQAELKFQDERVKRLAELFGTQDEDIPPVNQKLNGVTEQIQIDEQHPEGGINQPLPEDGIDQPIREDGFDQPIREDGIDQPNNEDWINEPLPEDDNEPMEDV